MLTVLKCKKLPESLWSDLLQLRPELILPVAATFYWYNSSHYSCKEKVKALLFYFTEDKSCHRSPPRVQLNLETVHAFSEWQSVYSDALALNYMLRSPFHATNPAMLYSGENVLYYASWNSDLRYPDQKKMFEIITYAKTKPAK